MRVDTVRSLIASALFALLMPFARAAPESASIRQTDSAAPTIAEVEFYTRPLVKARLRIPESLHSFAVTAITPLCDDPSRFEVAVRFRARTPFGGVTEYSTRFQMKPASSKGVWITTAK